MRKLIALSIALLFCLSFAVERDFRWTGEKFKQYTLFETDGSGTGDTIFLDSAETDTSSDIWNMKEWAQFGDSLSVIATVVITCADSAGGSDSLDVSLIAQANWTDGTASHYWEGLDTVTVSSDDGTAQTEALNITSALSFPYMRFVLIQAGQEAAEKPACYNMRILGQEKGKYVN